MFIELYRKFLVCVPFVFPRNMKNHVTWVRRRRSPEGDRKALWNYAKDLYGKEVNFA